MSDIRITSFEGSEFDVLCSLSRTGTGPGLIVIQEADQALSDVRELCDRYAAMGYLALGPDLFWRHKGAARQERVSNGFDVEASMRDLLSVLGYIRTLKGCNGKVGAVGFGEGGRLAYLLSARSDVDASVGYYGTGIDQHIDEFHEIRMPLLLHFAADDARISESVRRKILLRLSRNQVIASHVYEGAGHGFAWPKGPTFNAAAAELAEKRTREFLAENLVN